MEDTKLQLGRGDGLLDDQRRSEELIGSGPQTNITTAVTTTWYVRSKRLGGAVVVEVDGQGNRQRANIYAAGGLLARQRFSQGGVRYVGE